MSQFENTNPTEPSQDTQPSRIKKKQQQRLALGLLMIGILGWVFYVVMSGQISSQPAVKPENKPSFQLESATAHVNSADVWMEHTQNALVQTQKNTTELQQQLQLLTAQKESQEKTHQSQQETLQALQTQLRALEQQLTAKASMHTSVQSPTINSGGVLSQPSRVDPLPGVVDDVLDLSPRKPPANTAPFIKPSKTPDTFVPAGTFVRAVMLGGADASTGVNSQSNPTPVLLRLLDSGILPNRQRSHLKDCVATAAAIGDISSERGLMRLERLSCVSPNHREVIELPVEGTVFGPEGKNGVRGVPLWREGALLKRAFIAGTLSGFSEGIASQYTTSSISPSGAVNTINNADIFKFGAAQGVSNAMDKIADYNIRRADQYHPVIQLSAGTIVDVVFLKGFYLDGQKHDHDSESIVPPFESMTATASLFPSSVEEKSPVITSPSPSSTLNSADSPVLPVSPLPLTSAQINALQTQNSKNPATDFFKP